MNALALIALLAAQSPVQEPDAQGRKLQELGDFAFRCAFVGAGKVTQRLSIEKDPRGTWVQILEFQPEWSASGSIATPKVLKLRQMYNAHQTHIDHVPLEVEKRYLVFGRSIGNDWPVHLRKEFEGILRVTSFQGAIFEIKEGRLAAIGESMYARILHGLEESAARELLVDGYASAKVRDQDYKEEIALWQASGIDDWGDSVMWAGTLTPKLGVPFKAEVESSTIYPNRWFRGLHPIRWNYVVPTDFEETLKLFEGYSKRRFDGTPLQGGKDTWLEKWKAGIHQTVALRWHAGKKGTQIEVTEQPVLVGQLPNWPKEAKRAIPDVSWLKPPLQQLSGQQPIFVRRPIGAATERRIFTLGYLMEGERDEVLRKVLDELGPEWSPYTRSDSVISFGPKQRIKNGWYSMWLAPLGLEGGADAARSLFYATWVEPR